MTPLTPCFLRAGLSHPPEIRHNPQVESRREAYSHPCSWTRYRHRDDGPQPEYRLGRDPDLSRRAPTQWGGHERDPRTQHELSDRAARESEMATRKVSRYRGVPLQH